jgi:hypothetical protein
MTTPLTIKRITATCAVAFMVFSASVTSVNAAPGALNVDGKDWPEIVASLPAIDIVPPAPTPATVLGEPSERVRTQMFDKKSTPLAGALFTMMILDTKSTYDSNAWCRTCVESNPFAAPFINAGAPVAYTAGIAFDTGVMYIAHRMRNSWNPIIRKIWFVLPVSLAAGHAYAMHHNYQLRKTQPIK